MKIKTPLGELEGKLKPSNLYPGITITLDKDIVACVQYNKETSTIEVIGFKPESHSVDSIFTIKKG